MGDSGQMSAFPPLVRGNRLFAQGDYSGAIQHYTAAIDEDDSDVTALCNRSAAYIEMELFKTAIKDADAALAIDPTCTKAWERKGQALEAQGKRASALEAWKQGLLAGGELDSYLKVLSLLGVSPSCNSSVRSSPAPSVRSSPAPSTSSLASAPAKASPAAGRVRSQSVQLPGKPAGEPPAAGDAAELLARLRAQQRAQEEQQAQLVKQQQELVRQQQEINAARAAQPRVPARGGYEDAQEKGQSLTLSASSRSAIDKNDPAQIAAIAAAQNLIAHGVGNATTDEQIALGYLQVNTGNYKLGMELFDKLLEANPKLIAAYLGRGTAQALQGNLTGAGKDFSTCIEIDPKCSDAWKRRGQTRAALGFDAEAVKDLTKASKISPDHECFHQRGIVYHKTHDYRNGLADFRKALDMEARNPITWNFVGLCENALGHTRESVIAYERATQLDPTFKEAWANMAQAHRDSGDRKSAEKYFAQALKVDPSYTHGYHLRGLLYYGCGEIRLALADFRRGVELDPSDRNCQLMKAVCLNTLGVLSEAVAEYGVLLKMDPQHQCYYQREIALWLHRHLDAEMLATNPDVSLDAYFKEAYCKRHPTSHPRMCNYRPQKPLNAKIPDVRLLDTPESKDIRRIVELSRKYGRLIQLNTPGFLSNLRQHRSCGLSILQMAQQARAFWLGGGKGAARKRDGGDGSKATLYFDPAGSSKDSGRQHDFGWRDFMDICVKWRQISEPNDPVFWIDLLAPEAFAEGFGLQTPMVTGQMNVVRYFPYFARSLEVVKKLIAGSGACNVHDQRFMLPRQKLDELEEARDCKELWDVMQQGFYVETPCHSIARPNKIMAGTRITLLQKPPAGFDFTIRTPGTPPRWVEMDGEMAHVWKLLRAEAQRQPAPNLDRFTELALTFYFYWVNFGPLSRGTAACGYIAFFALMLSIGYEVDVSPPQGTQVDWPAILTPRPSEFAAEVGTWINPGRKPSSALDECPCVSAAIATPREMLMALNMV